MTSLYRITIVHDLHLSSTILLQRMLRYHWLRNDHTNNSSQHKSELYANSYRIEEKNMEKKIVLLRQVHPKPLGWTGCLSTAYQVEKSGSSVHAEVTRGRATHKERGCESARLICVTSWHVWQRDMCDSVTCVTCDTGCQMKYYYEGIISKATPGW